MSISNALHNAGSGLRANSRLVDTLSNNVANELTPGYARRVTELASASVGGYGSGVTVVGTERVEDLLLTSERRLGDATAAAATVESSAYTAILDSFGEPGADGALSTLVTKLESALMTAVASPQSQALLQGAVSAAASLVDGVNRVARSNMAARAEADAEIGRQVTALNDALNNVDDLNREIVAMGTQGVDTLGLQDQRAILIDRIGAMVPVRTVLREGGAVALYTQNGGLLVDAQVYELSFTPTGGIVTADMTIGAGLSALRQDQKAAGGPVTLDTASARGPMTGGSLGALFAVRDRILPQFDGEIDNFAAELISRLEAVQATGANTGLVVDSDTAAGPAGLALRLRLNAAVDPEQGGALSALRSGIGAVESTEAGYGGHLQKLADALSSSRVPTGWASQAGAADAATMASNIASFFATLATDSESDRAYLVARQTTLVEQEASRTGVSSDTELQTLMLVEQAYAANARVITVIDEMLQLLLEA